MPKVGDEPLNDVEALNDTGLVDVDDEVAAPILFSFFFLFTGVLRGDLLGVVLVFSFFEFVRLLPPPPPPTPPLVEEVVDVLLVVDDDVDEAGDIERSSLDLSLPRGLRPLLLLLRDVEVRRFEANQSSS